MCNAIISQDPLLRLRFWYQIWICREIFCRERGCFDHRVAGLLYFWVKMHLPFCGSQEFHFLHSLHVSSKQISRFLFLYSLPYSKTVEKDYSAKEDPNIRETRTHYKCNNFYRIYVDHIPQDLKPDLLKLRDFQLLLWHPRQLLFISLTSMISIEASEII